MTHVRMCQWLALKRSSLAEAVDREPLGCPDARDWWEASATSRRARRAQLRLPVEFGSSSTRDGRSSPPVSIGDPTPRDAALDYSSRVEYDLQSWETGRGWRSVLCPYGKNKLNASSQNSKERKRTHPLPRILNFMQVEVSLLICALSTCLLTRFKKKKSFSLLKKSVTFNFDQIYLTKY